MKNLQMQIANKQLQPLYIFTGEEVGIMDAYVKQMRTIIDYKKVDDVASIIPNISTRGLLGTKNNNYIVFDDMDFIKNGDVKELSEQLALTGSHIILIYSNIDKRTSLWKKNKDIIVVFEPLDPRVLAKYIERDIGLPPKQGQMLARMCNNNYARIVLECDKIKQYAEVHNLDAKDALYELAKYDMIYVDAKDVVFEFIDALTNKDIHAAYDKLEEMKMFGSNAIGALTLAYNNFKALTALQLLGTTENIEQRTGVPYWHAKNNVFKAGKYTDAKLIDILDSIQFIDQGIKTGLIDISIALDVLLGRIFGGA